MLGQVMHRIYKDDCDGVHPNNLNRLYSTDREEKSATDNGVCYSIADIYHINIYLTST